MADSDKANQQRAHPEQLRLATMVRETPKVLAAREHVHNCIPCLRHLAHVFGVLGEEGIFDLVDQLHPERPTYPTSSITGYYLRRAQQLEEEQKGTD